MGGVLCAVRGGPDSQPTVARAIALAREKGLTLVFLYVVNLDFLLKTSSVRVQTATEQLAQMGEFILLAAQAQAEAAGVVASGVVRTGSVMEEMTALCHELKVEYLVLGTPRPQREDSVFTEEMLAIFVATTEVRTGARVVLADGAAQ